MPNLTTRLLVFIVALSLLTAACTAAESGSTVSQAPATQTTESAEGAVATTSGGPVTTTTPDTSTRPRTERTEFNPGDLSLGSGGNFVSLDDPVMIPASAATWLNPDDVVLGIVTLDGTAQAFPIRQMSYHHIANTTIDGEPYLVTY